MIIHKKTDLLIQARDRDPHSSFGFVPTMGNLHHGHLTLVEKALAENDQVIVSIFVNPKQFGPSEDFASYPRTLEKDCQQLQELAQQEKIIVYAPESIEEVFPPDFKTSIQVQGLTNKLCGQQRPGHFEGVCTVVYRLFKLTRPHRVYLGQKDYQQFLVIQQMVKDLELPLELKMVPIVRNQKGLALSSRNSYLSSEQQDQALELPHTLSQLEELIQKHDLDQALLVRHQKTQLAHWEYLDILDAKNLAPLGSATEKVLLAGALKVGETRLIDNHIIDLPRYA